MITAWTSHLDSDEDKERFRRQVRSAKAVLDRVKSIIEERERAINLIETGVDIYSKPGWDALLAHYNGEKWVLNWIKKLIDLDQQKEHFNDRGNAAAGPTAAN